MNRPSPYTSYLGNYVGDVPPANSRTIVPQERLPLTPNPLGPFLIAEPGYVPAPGWGRFYYAADDGIWRDTETGAAYSGPARSAGETP